MLNNAADFALYVKSVDNFIRIGAFRCFMNMADSMKHILRNRTHVFTDFWKEDLKKILTELTDDFKHLMKDGKDTVGHVKKFSLQDMIDAGSDSILVMKVLPKRIRTGFAHFKDDLHQELELLPEQKQKTIFTLKVIGALTSFTLSTVYTFRKSNQNFSMKGFKKFNPVTQFLITELIFRISHAMVNRFLNELESHVSDEAELAHIRYFQELLSSKNSGAGPDQPLPESGDRSIEIVENFKKYIMTGKRGIG